MFDDSFERLFGTVATGTANGPANGQDGVAAPSPALRVAETPKAHTVTLEVPGVAKEDVKVSVDGRQVTVQAQGQRHPERKDGERVLHRERPAASYARTFALPAEVDQTDANAKLDNGVLTLTLRKRSARSAAQITVN
ncbi:MAG: Hsp20/alpha crystallin family protein [Rubrivivax sp.]|nr:Hsp20/alpha crystallin family protein [Rubrivivax sp.]